MIDDTPGVEYRVLPAPRRGRKAPGVKTPEGRFALGVEDILNEMARDGWQYLRSDILPSDERQGLTSTATVYRSVLVFVRALAPAATSSAEATAHDVAQEAARSLTVDQTET